MPEQKEEKKQPKHTAGQEKDEADWGTQQPGSPDNPDDAGECDENEKLNDQTRQIIETGSVTMSDGKHLIHCLTIIGQVEGHYILPPQNKTTKYEHVIPQIVAVEEDPQIEGLLIILNTVGGDVEAGLAIAELISGMKKPTVSLVLGGGHSIGVPLAICARESFIAPTATMTIHPVRMNGIVVGVPQTLSYFDKMQDRIGKFVAQNSHIAPERFKQLMMHTGELVLDVGTVLEGEEAVREGLIDHTGGLSDALASLYRMIDEHRAQQGTQAANASAKGKGDKTVKKSAQGEKHRKGRSGVQDAQPDKAAHVAPKHSGHRRAAAQPGTDAP